MKGIDNLLEPVTGTHHNCVGFTTFAPFNYYAMSKGSSLMDTIRQYPPELIFLLGGVTTSDSAGGNLMRYIGCNRASARSDSSIKDDIYVHAFSISDNNFTQAI